MDWGLKDEKFLGRVEEQDRFREALRSLLAQPSLLQRLSGVGRQTHEPLPFVFLLYGEGGMGKSTLAAQLRQIALNEDQFRGRFRPVSLDWEQRKTFDRRLAVHDAVSPEVVYEHIYAAFRDAGFGREFDPYERAVRTRDEAEHKVAQALDRASTEGHDRYAPLRELGGKGLAWLVRTGLPVVGPLLPEEPTAKAFEAIIGGGAEGLARAREMGTTLLRARLSPDEFDLFTLPHETLARHLAAGIEAVARQGPILLTLDTYETVDHVDPWVRLVIRRAGPRVVWVLAGRNNLADSRKYGAGYFTGYRGEFPGERLRVFPLSEFSVGDITEYFQHRVPRRPLTEGEAEAIHEATLGIPLAVKEAAAIWARPETTLQDITGDEPPSRDRRKVVERVTARFLLHCFDDPRERSRLYALALAYRADADLVAAMLETEELERDLSELERRHSFVFVRDMTLHDAVKTFIREYLLADVRRTGKDVRSIHEYAVTHLRAKVQARESRLPTLEARVSDEQWTADTTALVHHAFWLSEDQGRAILLPALVAGLAYDDSFSRALLDAAEPLRLTLSNAGRRRLDLLRTRRPWSPNLEQEATFLAEIQASQRDWLEDGCDEERQAILALKRGQLLFRQERKSEALRQYERAKLMAPHEAVELRRQLGEAMYELASELMWPESSQGATYSLDAERGLEYAVELAPEKWGAWYYRGVIYKLVGRYEQAIAAYQRAIELDPKYAHPHNGLGNVYYNLGQYEQAIAAYQRAIELDPKDASPHNGLGNVHHKLGQYEQAIAAYQRAIELDPKYAYPHYGLGIVYRTQGQFAPAMVAYQRAIELDPKLAYPHNGLGYLYRCLGQYERAIAAYEQAVALDPKGAIPHYNLGEILMLRGRLEEAERELMEYIALDPINTFAPLWRLGVIARYKGLSNSTEHFRGALGQWGSAWRRPLQTPTRLLEGRALALLCTGNKTEALKTLAEAIERLLPGDPIDISPYELLQRAPEPPEGIAEMVAMLREAQAQREPATPKG